MGFNVEVEIVFITWFLRLWSEISLFHKLIDDIANDSFW